MGEDAQHLIRSLRVQAGQQLLVCDGKGTDYACTVREVGRDYVSASVAQALPCQSEPQSRVTLYQALPKGEKLEYIIQKSVELGVFALVPMHTRNCVSRPSQESGERKRLRWQRIADEAAKQCGRGVLPQVLPPVSFTEALEACQKDMRRILFHEKAQRPLRGLVGQPADTAVFIGPEGGFAPHEVEAAAEAGVYICSLGPRVLRCETAGLCALSVLLAAEEIL